MTWLMRSPLSLGFCHGLPHPLCHRHCIQYSFPFFFPQYLHSVAAIDTMQRENTIHLINFSTVFVMVRLMTTVSMVASVCTPPPPPRILVRPLLQTSRLTSINHFSQPPVTRVPGSAACQPHASCPSPPSNAVSPSLRLTPFLFPSCRATLV